MTQLVADLDRMLGAPRAQRVHWLLALFAGGAAGAQPDEVSSHLGGFFRSPERFLHIVRFWGGRMGTHRAVETSCDAEGVISVVLRDEKGRPWTLRCWIGGAPPFPLEYFRIARSLPPGVRVRLATEDDADALAALERSCPIERDDGSRVTLVRGKSVFDQLRLADWAWLWLAEEDGVPVACDMNAAHRARIAGRDVDLVYRCHTRVAPSHRRLGLNETLGAILGEERFRRGIPADAMYVYVDPRNQVVRDWSPNIPWRVRPFRALLPCRAAAGPRVGRPATRADARQVAALLNSAHEREVLFLPYDAERLTERLERVPERYGFAQLRVCDDAAIGIWEDGEQRVLEHAGVREESRRATVPDWGFAPGGGLASLEGLLRAACSELAGRGITHLSIFASSSSPAAPLLRSLAQSVVEIEFQCMLPESSDSAERGIYVDPVYY
jgi:hypothetical protein